MSEVEDICIAMRKLQVKQDAHIWATPTAVLKTLKSIDPNTKLTLDKIVHIVQYSGGDKICIASLKSVLDRGFLLKKGLGVVGGSDYKIWDVVFSLRPSTCKYPAGMTCDARTCKCKQYVGKAPVYEVLTEEQKKRMGLTAEEAEKRKPQQVRQTPQYFKYKGKLYRKKPVTPVKKRVVPNKHVKKKVGPRSIPPGSRKQVVRKIVTSNNGVKRIVRRTV
ncbi:hypothetical protein ACFLRC_01375 [Candidatus Altiarchaeota archaeon]